MNIPGTLFIGGMVIASAAANAGLALLREFNGLSMALARAGEQA